MGQRQPVLAGQARRLVTALERDRREYDARCRPLVEAAARAQEIIPTDELEAGIVREPAVRYAGDPCWIVARYPGTCRRCGETVPLGVRTFSYPNGRMLLCQKCGGLAAAEFEEAARLEAVGGVPVVRSAHGGGCPSRQPLVGRAYQPAQAGGSTLEGRWGQVGFVTCGVHQRVRCCWRCERCPKCDGIGRLRPGDYCADCVAWMKAHGCRWSAYTRDYIRDEDSQSLIPVKAPDADARIGGFGSG